MALRVRALKIVVLPLFGPPTIPIFIVLNSYSWLFCPIQNPERGIRRGLQIAGSWRHESRRAEWNFDLCWNAFLIESRLEGGLQSAVSEWCRLWGACTGRNGRPKHKVKSTSFLTQARVFRHCCPFRWEVARASWLLTVAILPQNHLQRTE